MENLLLSMMPFFGILTLYMLSFLNLFMRTVELVLEQKKFKINLLLAVSSRKIATSLTSSEDLKCIEAFVLGQVDMSS